MIKTGIAIEIPEGYFGAIFARSGLATKQGLRPANCVGVIDSDYRGEIIVALHNDTSSEFGFIDLKKVIHKGDRIAQLVILPYLSIDFIEVNELSDTVRGDGGFGSTGMTDITISEHSTTGDNIIMDAAVTISLEEAENGQMAIKTVMDTMETQEESVSPASLLKPEFINKDSET